MSVKYLITFLQNDPNASFELFFVTISTATAFLIVSWFLNADGVK